MSKRAPQIQQFTKPQPDPFTSANAVPQAGPYSGGGVGYSDDGAGREAADGFRPIAADRQLEVLEHLGDTPATADVLAARINRPVHHVRPRLTELAAFGWAIKCPGRGVSAYGAPASLWRRATAEERAISAARRAAEDEHGPGAA